MQSICEEVQRRITKNEGGIAGEKRRVDAEKARVAVGGSHAGQSGASQQVSGLLFSPIQVC